MLSSAAIPAAVKAAEAVESIPALPDPRTSHPDYFETYNEDGQMVARGIENQWFTAVAGVSDDLCYSIASYVSPKLRIK